MKSPLMNDSSFILHPSSFLESIPRRLAHASIAVAAAPVKAPVTRDINRKYGISLSTAACLTNNRYATKNCDIVWV